MSLTIEKRNGDGELDIFIKNGIYNVKAEITIGDNGIEFIDNSAWTPKPQIKNEEKEE